MNTNIRPVSPNETDAFYNMLCRLDRETKFMMYEPGEREKNTSGKELLWANITAAAEGGDLLLAAEDSKGKLVGFIWAERGKQNRIRHTAYIVTGILEAYRGQGIGTEFFSRLDCWARENDFVRLELTVECNNVSAKHLYEKSGFFVEGVRQKSMKVDGEFVDEYYMAKVI